MGRRKREEVESSRETGSRNEASARYRELLASGDWVDPYNIPAHLKHPDKECAWLNVETMGMENEARLSSFEARGYEPARPEDYPDLSLKNKYSSRRSRDIGEEYIKKGGNMLFERDKDVANIEYRKLKEKNRETIRSMKAANNNIGQGLFPSKVITDTFTHGPVDF